MREFLDRLKYKLEDFMEGRYGMDELNKLLFILIFVCLIIQLLIVQPILGIVGWVLIILLFFRLFSKNTAKRELENEKYLTIIKGPKKFINFQKKKWQNKDTTLYFKCKGCGTQLSVPKGKGKLRIVCPKCKTEIYKNT